MEKQLETQVLTLTRGAQAWLWQENSPVEFRRFLTLIFSNFLKSFAQTTIWMLGRTFFAENEDS